MPAATESTETKRSLASKGISVLIFGGLIFSTAIWLLFVAAGVYAFVHHWYIPQSEVRSAVHFSYNRAFEGSSLCVIDLVDLPLSHVDYSLNLGLELQRSDRNKQAGNFRVVTSLAEESKINSTIEEMRRHPVFQTIMGKSENTKVLTGILPYKSPLLESLDTLTFAPLYVFGFIKQTSMVDLRLFDQIRSLKRKYRYAVVNIIAPVDLESAALIWKPQLKGIRYLMLQYPLLSFFFGTLFVWFWELSATLGTIIYIRSRIARTDNKDTESVSQDIQIPRRNMSRRHYKSPTLPSDATFEYSHASRSDVNTPPNRASSPEDAGSNRESVRETTWAEEFERSHGPEDTSNISHASDTVEAETPATTIDDLESFVNQSGAHGSYKGESSGVSSGKSDTAKYRK